MMKTLFLSPILLVVWVAASIRSQPLQQQYRLQIETDGRVHLFENEHRYNYPFFVLDNEMRIPLLGFGTEHIECVDDLPVNIRVALNNGYRLIDVAPDAAVER